MPMHDLNHCRSASTNVTVAIGTSKIAETSRAMRSKAGSAGVSRIA